MSGRVLLFIHAALGTLAIFAAQRAEKVAELSQLPKNVVQVLIYLGVFTVLLALDWSAGYFHKMSQRRLDQAGRIDGCWLEISRPGQTGAFNMGAFVELTYSTHSGFAIEGEVFDQTGKHLGHFNGHGAPRGDGRTLTYSYDGRHGGIVDTGDG